MSKYLEQKFALSEQGARDLSKAVVACVLSNIGLMLPTGLLFLLLRNLIYPLLGYDGQPVGLGTLMLFSGIILVFNFIFAYLQYNATFLSSYTESANMRIRLAEKLRLLPLSFFGKRDLADLTTTIMTDCAKMERAFSHFIPQTIGAAISTLLIGAGMLITDYRMGIAALWVVPVAFILSIGLRPFIDRMEWQQRDKKLVVSDGIQECLETIQDIKANNQTADYLAELDEKVVAVENTTLVLELINGTLVTSSQMVLKVGMATTVLAGTKLLLSGRLDLMVFLMFLIAATRVYGPLIACLINLSAVFSTMISVERMQAVEQQEVQTGNAEPKYQGYDIVFDHVGFSYENGETVLRDVSFTARQNQVTALVGPSGGGKSTATRLAARFWDVRKGSVTIGGTDVSTVDPEQLLREISIVFQDVVLFNNTVMENIRLGRKEASDAEVIAAARAARCEEFINRLPGGYECKIGENGSALSGGERQRISIARALLKNAPIILLDEATASLDVENESLVQEALSNLIRNKTVLIIAHRMRTVAGADHIVVLKDGVVAEEGTPQELMDRQGIYCHMADLQRQSLEWSLNAGQA